MSRASWIIASLTPLSDKISLHKLQPGDVPALLELIARLRTRIAAALGRPVEMVCCYEAGYDGFWLHRRLQAEGVRCLVFDPASLQVNRRARQAKTDRIDAHSLIRALLAHLGGEPRVVSVVRVPSPEQEDARRLHRERDRLVSERVQHVNRIKGLLASQGIYDYQPLRRDRAQRLEALQTGDGRPLPARLKAELERELRRLELVLEMLAQIEAERDALLVQPAPAHPHAEKIQALAKLKGIGPEFASVLVGEVFYREFDNRRQLASYVGLAPSPFCSGRMQQDQGTSKAGNAKARSSLIELSWRGCATSPRARSAAGSVSGWAVSRAGFGALRWWRWRASC